VLKRDTATVIPLLVTERIRRGTQLYEALVADLQAQTIHPDAAEIEGLLHAIERPSRGIESEFIKPTAFIKGARAPETGEFREDPLSKRSFRESRNVACASQIRVRKKEER